MLDIFKPEFELCINQYIEQLQQLATNELTREQMHEKIQEARENIDHLDVFVASVP
jgi:hypothetical protein